MKIETKFNPNQTVFMLVLNKVQEVTVGDIAIKVLDQSSSIAPDDIQIEYNIGEHPERSSFNPWISEDNLFATKQDLLDSL